MVIGIVDAARVNIVVVALVFIALACHSYALPIYGHIARDASLADLGLPCPWAVADVTFSTTSTEQVSLTDAALSAIATTVFSAENAATTHSDSIESGGQQVPDSSYAACPNLHPAAAAAAAESVPPDLPQATDDHLQTLDATSEDDHSAPHMQGGPMRNIAIAAGTVVIIFVSIWFIAIALKSMFKKRGRAFPSFRRLNTQSSPVSRTLATVNVQRDSANDVAQPARAHTNERRRSTYDQELPPYTPSGYTPSVSFYTRSIVSSAPQSMVSLPLPVYDPAPAHPRQ